jgi:molybdopterin-guanine dinucleotide biosynthesis protein A
MESKKRIDGFAGNVVHSRQNAKTIDGSLFILAGGSSSRFGSAGKAFPKFAFVVYDEPIIIRNLRQALAAGFPKVVVSCRPSQVNLLVRIICSSLSGLEQESIEVLPNRSHETGPLPALLTAIESAEQTPLAVSLGDIYFFENPFLFLRDGTRKPSITLGVSDLYDNRELSLGGIVVCEDEYVTSIKESRAAGIAYGLKWTGISMLCGESKLLLQRFLSLNPDCSPIGDFFEYCRSEGKLVTAVKISDFINVNTSHDLFVASLYRAMELNNNFEVFERLHQTAQLMRTQNIKRRYLENAAHLLQSCDEG